MQENTQEKSPIKQRMLLFLAEKGMTQYEFYKNTGVTRGVLAQNNGISEDIIYVKYGETVVKSYDTTIPNNSDYITVGGRANNNVIVTFIIYNV